MRAQSSCHGARRVQARSATPGRSPAARARAQCTTCARLASELFAVSRTIAGRVARERRERRVVDVHAPEPHERRRHVGHAERVDAARDARADAPPRAASVTRSEHTTVPPSPGAHTAVRVAVERRPAPSGSSPTTIARAGTPSRTSSTTGDPSLGERRRRRDDDEVHRARARLGRLARRPAVAHSSRSSRSTLREDARAGADRGAHGFLQRRPSRASRSSACSGPHEPAA